MNERIKELALQAEWRFANKATGEFSEYDKRLLKFAELIVRECAEFQTNRSTERHGYDKHEDGVAIKQHFGVEEWN